MTQITTGTERAKAAEVMAACACYNLRKATRAVTQMLSDALRSTGLRATQFTLLTFLSGLGPVRITDLAKAVGMDYTTLVRNLNLLKQEWARGEPFGGGWTSAGSECDGAGAASPRRSIPALGEGASAYCQRHRPRATRPVAV